MVQVFEHMHGQQFRAVPQDLTVLQARRFVLLHPNAFLCTLDHEPRFIMERSNLIISGDDMQRFHLFKINTNKISKVVQGLTKGRRGQKESGDVDSD